MAPLVLLQTDASLEEVLAWHPHPDTWLFVGFLAFAYWFVGTRLAPYEAPRGEPALPRRKVISFSAGLLAFWLVRDWPIHDIGEGSLFTFHMVEHLVMAFVAAPLLLMGVPAWMARWFLRTTRLLRPVRSLSRPVTAFFVFNAALAGLHWPAVLEAMVTNEVAHVGVHAVLFAAALFLWMPVLSPLPEVPKLGRPAQMMYLFANSLIPTVPASFLIFGTEPLYSVYESAPRLWGWSAMTDQAVAGIIMKLGGGLLLWATIAVIWFRWYGEQRAWDAIEADFRESSSASR